MNAKDIKREIGKRLAQARENAGYTLEALAKLTNGVLSTSRISNYERGRRQPGSWEVLVLNRILRSSPTYLMCLDEGNEMLVGEEKFIRDWRALPENIRMDFARKIAALALAYIDVATTEPAPKKKKRRPIKQAR